MKRNFLSQKFKFFRMEPFESVAIKLKQKHQVFLFPQDCSAILIFEYNLKLFGAYNTQVLHN